MTGGGSVVKARRIHQVVKAARWMRLRWPAGCMRGCHHTAITKAAQRDEQFAAEIEQAERISESLPLLRVVKASRKSWRAAA